MDETREIEAIESMPAGRPFDRLVAVEVMGWSCRPRAKDDLAGYRTGEIWSHPDAPARILQPDSPRAYSASPQAAWEVAEWMRRHGSEVLIAWDEDFDAWECSWISSGVRRVGRGPTMPLAVCRAALAGVRMARETTSE